MNFSPAVVCVALVYSPFMLIFGWYLIMGVVDQIKKVPTLLAKRAVPASSPVSAVHRLPALQVDERAAA